MLDPVERELLRRLVDALEGQFQLDRMKDARDVILGMGQYAWCRKELARVNMAIATARGVGSAQAYQAVQQMQFEIIRITHEMEWLKKRFPGIQIEEDKQASKKNPQPRSGVLKTAESYPVTPADDEAGIITLETRKVD